MRITAYIASSGCVSLACVVPTNCHQPCRVELAKTPHNMDDIKQNFAPNRIERFLMGPFFVQVFGNFRYAISRTSAPTIKIFRHAHQPKIWNAFMSEELRSWPAIMINFLIAIFPFLGFGKENPALGTALPGA